MKVLVKSSFIWVRKKEHAKIYKHSTTQQRTWQKQKCKILKQNANSIHKMEEGKKISKYEKYEHCLLFSVEHLQLYLIIHWANFLQTGIRFDCKLGLKQYAAETSLQNFKLFLLFVHEIYKTVGLSVRRLGECVKLKSNNIYTKLEI